MDLLDNPRGIDNDESSVSMQDDEKNVEAEVGVETEEAEVVLVQESAPEEELSVEHDADQTVEVTEDAHETDKTDNTTEEVCDVIDEAITKIEAHDDATDDTGNSSSQEVVRKESGWVAWLSRHWIYIMWLVVAVLIVIPFFLRGPSLKWYLVILYGIKLLLYIYMFYMNICDLLLSDCNIHAKAIMIVSIVLIGSTFNAYSFFKNV
jgi:hypothetical protein